MNTSNPNKLFVGQLPKHMTEEQLRPLFQQYGNIVELSIIRDKATGLHKGCAFLTYSTREEAEECLNALHNKHTLPSMNNPIQVKWSGTDAISNENKLFIGMIPKTSTVEELLPIFTPFGEIEELSILKGHDGTSKGCAFLRYINRDSAVAAITALNGALKMPGAPSHLVVKFAESEKQKTARSQVNNVQQQQLQQLQLLQMGNPFMNPLMAAAISAAAQNQYGMYDQYGGMGAGAGGQGTGANATDPNAMNAFFGYNPYGMGMGMGGGYNPLAMGGMGGMGMGGMGGMGGCGGGGSGGPAGSKQEGPPGANLFVYHIPPEFGDMDLFNSFASFGNLLSAKVFMDKDTNMSRCFGFVSYEEPEAAQAAIAQMNGFSVGGKRLKVQLKNSQAPRGGPGAGAAGLSGSGGFRPY